jgi:hypothetical protein
MANQQLKNVKAQTKAKSITTIDCNQNRGCVFVNFINKCCLPISFLIVYQMLLYILANIVNQATTTNGYWQIFVVIPAIDKALPDLTNQLAMAIIMDIIYIYIYTINYLLIPIYFY